MVFVTKIKLYHYNIHNAFSKFSLKSLNVYIGKEICVYFFAYMHRLIEEHAAPTLKISQALNFKDIS